ncbi:hypothetical protein Q9L42_003075 [Methylomarinum sp. Ch1-1]|uniref:Uncharacterized protein n=1 Tax=Methylomarinum roseum TaxID=3067653 RepID=A0AAU7NVU3_9GAMM|nr:hypothetical protein [Methylomarinum sp. Ch1-1]MDP4522836.1 hypothetical protein [Methylomarinum sp. Ch1-1]
MAILADALQTAYEQHGFIVDVAEAIVQDLQDRGVSANQSEGGA